MPFAALDVILLAARPGETVRLERTFVAPTRIAPREHERYYGTECTHCHRASAALRDPDEGQKTLRFSGAGGIRFNCHHCNGLLKVVPDRIVLFKFEG